MLYAFMLMSTHGLTKNDQSRGFKKLNSRLFQNLKQDFRNAISIEMTGKSKFSKTPELTAAKRSAKLKGRIMSEETKRKMSKSAKARTNRQGFSPTDETRQRISASNKGKKKQTKKAVCPHCGTENTTSVITRLHLDRCKSLNGS